MTDPYAALRAAIDAGPKDAIWADLPQKFKAMGEWNESTRYLVAASPDIIRALLAERDDMAAHQSIGAAAFLTAVQGDGDWADEFLAWYKPAAWLSEERACAAFLAGKVVALTDSRDCWVQQASDRVDDAVQFAQERDALAATIKRACAGYPEGAEAVPTCVQILREATDADRGKESTA